MAKLFATENDGTDAALVDPTAMSPEEAQVTDVQVDTDAGISGTDGVDEVVANIEEGVDASGDLANVQELVEDAAEKGEGLTEVAAESIRLQIQTIARRIGADPRAVYSLYATENFASPSSRKPNTTFAAEGIKEFLKDLWAKLKAALTKLWAKVKAFWDKHVSNLGRVKKALESAKAKVKASSGNLKDKAFVEKAPGSLVSAFAGKGDIDAARVAEYIKAQEALSAANNFIVNGISTLKNVETAGVEIEKAFEQAPSGIKIVGGETLTISTEGDTETKSVKLEVTRTPIENKDTEAGLVVPNKETLTKLLTDTVKVIDDAIAAKKASEKTQKDSQAVLNGFEAEINNAEADPEVKANMRTAMSMLYRVNALSGKLQGIYASQNIRLAKAVLGFVGFSLKQYK
ncbi:hypothetical protein [Flavobacterium sp.]|uniref:hypothetical protein n=1 Tax=Flavobacterium sp. TaxID=239 RepID=UPI0037BEE5B3